MIIFIFNATDRSKDWRVHYLIVGMSILKTIYSIFASVFSLLLAICFGLLASIIGSDSFSSSKKLLN